MSKMRLFANLLNGVSTVTAEADKPQPLGTLDLTTKKVTEEDGTVRDATAAELQAAEAAAPAPAPVLTPAPAAQELATDTNVAYQNGFKASTDRFVAVMSSDAGKANASNAVFLLANSNATSDAIIAQLATQAPQANSGAPKKDLNKTPKHDLGVGTGAGDGLEAEGGKGEIKGADAWDSFDARKADSGLVKDGVFHGR